MAIVIIEILATVVKEEEVVADTEIVPEVEEVEEVEEGEEGEEGEEEDSIAMQEVIMVLY